MDETYKTTKEGLNKLKEDLKYREEVLKVKITNTLDEMRSQGDLSENDAYSMAVEEFHINEEKIMELKDKIRNAEIIKDKNKSKVGIGDTIILKNSKTFKYQIVSEDEANPLECKISYKSPIGVAVMDKKVGSKVLIETPSGRTEYKIESII
jgi:transcription elongation factor GreA